jgi:hypothetical protein
MTGINSILRNSAVEQQLRSHILPFVITAERLGRFPGYFSFRIYSYLKDFLTAVAGAGILPPVLNALAKIVGGEGGGGSALEVAKVPPWLSWIALGVAVTLIGLRVYFSREDVEKRWVLAQSCGREFRKLNVRLVNILNTAPDLEYQIKGIRNEVATIYQRHTSEESWPYVITEPGIEELVEQRLQVMLQQLKSNQNRGFAEIDQME